jgi:hypothetical protein
MWVRKGCRVQSSPCSNAGHYTYLFIRKEHFYPIELEDDEEARRHAELNPGTVRVEDIYGNVIWRQQ